MSYEYHKHAKSRWESTRKLKSWGVTYRRPETTEDVHDGLREYADVRSDYVGEPLDYATHDYRHYWDALLDRRSRRYRAADRERMFTRPQSGFVKAMKDMRRDEGWLDGSWKFKSL